MSSMKKLLSYRIRRNGFKGIKKDNRYYKSIAEQVKHDLRLEKMQKGYLIAPEKSSKNIYTYDENMLENIDNYVQEKLKRVKKEYYALYARQIPKNTKPFLTHVLTFNSSFSPNEEDAKRLHNAVVTFIEEKFGKENLISVSAHFDESSFDSVHFHMTTMNWDGRRTVGRNISTSLLQDEIQDHLIKHNVDFGFRRGVKKEISRANHWEVMESRNRQLKQLQKQLDEKQEENQRLEKAIEISKHEYNHLIKQYKSLFMQMGKMLHQIKSISDDTRTLGKLKKIDQLLEVSFKELNKKDLEKLIYRMEKGKSTLKRVHNAIEKKQEKEEDE